MADVKALLDGYRRFYGRHFTRRDPLFDQLATRGQFPKTLIIACSDSRVDPAIILDADPGDMFVVRNVANLVPPFETNSGHHGTSAAIEFAVRNLNVKHIIVFGHSACAGIGALLHGSPQEGEDSFIGRWMHIADEAKEHTLHVCGSADHPDARRVCEEQAVLTSLRNLMTFPWLKSRVEEGNLKLHGWHFELTSGTLCTWKEEEGAFTPIAAEL